MPELARRRQPISRRARPAKAQLSREAIVAAALGLIREDGDQRLTLRRLASELDTGAASLYVYFADTDDLYAAVLDELLGTIDVERGTRAWRERLVALLTSYVELLHAYPSLARTALITRPTGANSLNLWEAQLALLDEGGVRSGDGAWAVDLLLQLATATAAEHGARARRSETAAEDVRVAEAVEGLSADTHPHLAAVATGLLSGSPEKRLAWGLDVVLDGVLAAGSDA
jgi:AcrR family transcriptional regulator